MVLADRMPLNRHEIQVHSRNAENKATVYAEAAAHDALVGYRMGACILYDPSKYDAGPANQRLDRSH